jgi:hypothetical protein
MHRLHVLTSSSMCSREMVPRSFAWCVHASVDRFALFPNVVDRFAPLACIACTLLIASRHWHASPARFDVVVDVQPGDGASQLRVVCACQC